MLSSGNYIDRQNDDLSPSSGQLARPDHPSANLLLYLTVDGQLADYDIVDN